jgi:endonuclease/exonuclease/phosphatase family metal-dependent hydrolase
MATTVRIATFNCENLFARYRFKTEPDVDRISTQGWNINETLFDVLNDEEKRITAKAIKETKADVICLQEIEGLDVLKRFRNQRLGGWKSYPYAAVIEGNDPRLIDVAVLSKLPIIHVRSYQHVKETTSSRSFVFSRDCLEVDIDVNGTLFTIFINHLKSMMGGRGNTHERRKLQAKHVRKIVTEVFGAQAGQHPFCIVGDLNDYPQTDEHGPTALTKLTKWDQVENVIERLPEDEQWTHYYDDRDSYTQLDYILLAKGLESAVQSVEIERRGLPRRAERYDGPRFPGVGENSPKASDHCALIVELKI